ncbi:hypothetical protein [Granulicoccus sp. GXG6511]|uniref:hypothetical protein n=1 Tax=Granulicoccus sp. GXG6511 TaxID=3381351 RepID=UPI003D7D9ACD
MTSLLAPELERYLTRRVTWIGGVTTLGLLALASLFAGLQSRTSYQSEVELASFGPGMIVLAVALTGAWSYFTAASAIGSEQSSGALGTWLTFNPRRWPVYGAKLVSVVVPAAILSGVTLVAAVGWSLLVSTSSHPTAVGWMLAAAVRGVLLVMSIAALGFVLALVTRSTLGALGVLVGWLVLFVLQLLFGSAAGGYWQWIGLEWAAGEFLLNSEWRTYGQLHSDPLAIGSAGLVWFTFIAVVVVVGGLLFARRDID